VGACSTLRLLVPWPCEFWSIGAFVMGARRALLRSALPLLRVSFHPVTAAPVLSDNRSFLSLRHRRVVELHRRRRNAASQDCRISLRANFMRFVARPPGPVAPIHHGPMRASIISQAPTYPVGRFHDVAACQRSPG